MKSSPYESATKCIGTIDGPKDWSENLFHHLYGSPKRTEEEGKDEIIDSSFDHHDSYPGDIGIRFEPRK